MAPKTPVSWPLLGASFALGGAVDALVLANALVWYLPTEAQSSMTYTGQILLLLCVLSAVFVIGAVCGFVMQRRAAIAALVIAILALFVAAVFSKTALPAGVVVALTFGAGSLHAWLDGRRGNLIEARADRSDGGVAPRIFVFLWVAVGSGALAAIVGFVLLGASSLWIAAGAATLLGMAADV